MVSNITAAAKIAFKKGIRSPVEVPAQDPYNARPVNTIKLPNDRVVDMRARNPVQSHNSMEPNICSHG